jgi:hypothetical protein
MRNRSYQTINSTLRSRRLVVLLAATLLLTGSQFGGPSISAIAHMHASAAVIDLTTAPLLPGTLRVVDAGVGNQVDPHIDGNIVAYTNVDDGGLPLIKYFDLATNSGDFVPFLAPEESFLPDVSEGRIVYTSLNLNHDGTQVLSRSKIFDTATATGGLVTDGTQQRNSTIGGDLIAFEDRAFPNDQVEIVVYDFANQITSRLTEDTLLDLDPAVTPTGDAVVFQKCESQPPLLEVPVNCDIYKSVRTAPGVFTTSQLTSSPVDERNVDTNGALVVYESGIGTERNIAYKPLSGGEEIQIDLPGDQQNPSIAANLISFESRMPDGSEDVFVYDTTDNRLFRITDTPTEKFLNDITFSGGQFTLVFGVAGAHADLDVLAFTFELPESESNELEDLIALVVSFDLKNGTENSLVSKLEFARSLLEQGDTAGACDALTAFLNEVRAQSGKKIPTSEAQQLTDSATAIKQALGCQ